MIGHDHDEPLDEFRDPPQCPPMHDAQTYPQNCRVVNDQCKRCLGELGHRALLVGEHAYCLQCANEMQPTGMAGPPRPISPFDQMIGAPG